MKKKQKNKLFKNIKKEYLILAIIFLITFSFNIYFSFQVDEFTGGDSYTNLRKINFINENFKPMFTDDLSYGGRNYIDLPLFHYLVALFSLFMPLYLSAKIVPALLISSLCVIVYFISKYITKKSNVSFISSFMAAFIPSVIFLTLNKVSIYSLFIPLFFLTFYMFMKINDKKENVIYFVVAFILLMITHPMSFLLIFCLLIYLFIKYIEGSKIKIIEIEVITFVSFFILWGYFIIYKDLLLSLGPSAIWQAIPSYIRSQFFSNFDILTAIVRIGVLPFLFGLYMIYYFFFNYKKNYLYVSLPLSVLLLLWLQLIHFEAGLSILAISLVILFPHFFNLFLQYFEKTKFTKYENYVLLLIVLVFVFTSVIPSINYANQNIANSFNEDEINAMEWIKNNTNENVVILSSEIEGNLIAFKANRKNVIDLDFLNIENPERILREVKLIYTTLFETEAISLLEKYNVNYIYLSPRIKEYYNINDLRYKNSNCFDVVYSNEIEIIRSKCRMEVVSSG
ncbi:MAG: hypothetical protein ACMXX8_03010 [Candidatus Woesearchaeota archaeon]